jgi:hypothetical protein
LWTHQAPIAIDFARPLNNRIEVLDAKSMKITSSTLHFFEPAPLALIFFRQKKKNPQPLVAHGPAESLGKLLGPSKPFSD